MHSLVVFDLDDTLIDTKGTLLPDALDRVAAAAGVDRSRLDPAGKSIGEVLRDLPDLPPRRRRAAAEAWYSPDLPPVAPLPGAREALAALRGRTYLCLLTRGDPARQRAKLARAGLAELFDEVIVRPIEEPGCKRDDLVALLGRLGLPPQDCAVIGDDPRDELAHGAALGCLVLAVPETPLAAIPRRLEVAGLLGT